jgi:hypothetical protein
MILSYSFVKPAAKSYTPLNGTHPSRAEIANPFLNANPDIPTYKQAKAEYAKLQWQRAIIQRPTGSGGCQLTQSGVAVEKVDAWTDLVRAAEVLLSFFSCFALGGESLWCYRWA